MKQLKPILLTGCTASGKSRVAMELARFSPSVIINADAIQVYNCWQIISARPSVKDMNEFSHVLFGHVDCNDGYNVGSWLNDLKVQLASARKNNLRPIIVGGTGLYYTLLTEGISEIPPISTDTRNKSNTLLKNQRERLLSDLKKFDFQTFSRIDRTNFSRVQRAWEVLYETGKGISFWRKKVSPPILPIHKTIPILLKIENDHLKRNIQARFKKMVKLGVIDEVKAVVKREKVSENIKPASRAIGVTEIKQFIDNEINYEELEQLVLVKTRQYSKRQRTWFRNKFNSWESVEVFSDTDISFIAQAIEKKYKISS